MSLFLQFTEHDLLISVWKKEETKAILYDMLGDLAQELRTECENTIHGEMRQCEWLTVRVLLLNLLGPGARIFHRTNGEPYLQGDTFPKISISHTKDYVCIALHPTCDVGVDIEMFSNRVNRIASRIMSSSEEPENRIENEQRTWYNLLVWSAKESIFKKLDIRVLDYQRGIILTPFQVYKSGTISAHYHRCNYRYPIPVNYLCAKDFVLTWC